MSYAPFDPDPQSTAHNVWAEMKEDYWPDPYYDDRPTRAEAEADEREPSGHRGYVWGDQ